MQSFSGASPVWRQLRFLVASWSGTALLAAGLLTGTSVPAQQPSNAQKAALPWMDKTLPPDKRADMVIEQMTLDEKLQLVHGTGWGALRTGDPIPVRSNKGAGYVPGIDRLGIPDINEADSAVGVRMAALDSHYATLLPSSLGAAASWDPDGAFLYGSVIGRELRAQGFNMSIGGGVDITREPRNGRNFEYAGEDPVLAGTMVGTLMKGLQAQQIMGDIKHYALNDQETGRNVMSANIDKRSMRESDLLAFQIAVGIADPAGVMCAYNRINGDYSCENDYTLNQVLKKDFGFKGFVLSDWGGTHSTVKAALAGLDQDMPGDDNYFSEPLKAAVESGQVPMSRLNDMVHRILRSMFAVGVIDNPPMPRSVVDPFKGRDDAQKIAEESIVLLKNADNQLPLSTSVRSIAVIGSHADMGVMSGGGSAQVDAPGGRAGGSVWGKPVYFPSAPMRYIQEKVPGAKVEFNDGADAGAAASLAKGSDVAIVFVNQWMSEGRDAATLSLPDNQDALVSAVAAANPHTIVVLETGGPVTMPWAANVKGIMEAWYPGIGGGQAIANLLFGSVNPSGKLPVTFAASDADLPHPTVPGIENKPQPVTAEPGSKERRRRWEIVPFDVSYTEGVRVGYKWFESEHKQPLFAFGHGLSYTTYAYSDLKISLRKHTVSFTVKNTGTMAGAEIAQVYGMLPPSAGEPFKRLIGWERVPLGPGESKEVTVEIKPLYLSIFNEQKDGWDLAKGDYKVFVGPSSDELPLTENVHVVF